MPPRVAVEEGGKRVNGGMDQTSHSEGPRAQRQAPPLRIAPFYPTALHHGTPILGLHRRTGLGGRSISHVSGGMRASCGVSCFERFHLCGFRTGLSNFPETFQDPG